MALHYAIRRAASKFVPCVAKFVPSITTHHHQTSTLFAAAVGNSLPNFFPKPLIPSLIRRYSARPASDDSLLRVIESEIQCAEESHDSEEVEGIPPDFPFKIEDIPGEQTITLTREYQGENITVDVHMPDLTPEGEDEDDNDQGEQRGNPSSLPLAVRVSKKGGPILEFGCTAYADDISIESLLVKNPKNSSEDQMAYEGPDFVDLDENLQKAFHKYLEVRGINPSTTNFLHGYMIDKDGREYTTWLKNLQKFVQA